MPAGFQAFDADGGLLVDLSDRLARHALSGSYTVPSHTYLVSIAMPGANPTTHFASGYKSYVPPEYYDPSRHCSAWVTWGYIHFTSQVFVPGSILQYSLHRYS